MRIDTVQAKMGGTVDAGAGGRFELAFAAQFKGNGAQPASIVPPPDIRNLTPREMAEYGFRLFGDGMIDIHTLHRFRRELIATDGTPAADTKMDFVDQARRRLANLDAVFEPKSSTSYRSLRRLLDFAKP
ncbi:hypothetical protein ASE73_00130 [Sphingomonas sp. Leaf24]|uniref:hypothetical protein n=1 Tax=unclassified Sphingomonas TaxID=196159 RepID=UPI0006F31B46|nr:MULTISPECIES: hypothetical protein [unclassified Sphingomonas]KQM22701.1 hypothetical protein ASE50_00130 [Sphingomonas sp. Leaf5]KQM95557.1 hypothetical protein ASE73_00130 [Sphingomonas sp. Leaf24]